MNLKHLTATDQGGGAPRRDCYFAVDVETDGPVPGLYSMLSFAIVESGTHNGSRFVPAESTQTLYRELKPLADAAYDVEALRVNQLDRSHLMLHGESPEQAMAAASEWILKRAGDLRPVFVAWPAAFDWMFMTWYFHSFLGSTPFGYSGCFDVKTMIAVKMNIPLSSASVISLPDWMMEGKHVRTHNALDDAMFLAQVFNTAMEWRGPGDTLPRGGANV